MVVLARCDFIDRCQLTSHSEDLNAYFGGFSDDLACFRCTTVGNHVSAVDESPFIATEIIIYIAARRNQLIIFSFFFFCFFLAAIPHSLSIFTSSIHGNILGNCNESI